jgi:hypothetical protein
MVLVVEHPTNWGHLVIDKSTSFCGTLHQHSREVKLLQSPELGILPLRETTSPALYNQGTYNGQVIKKLTK